MCSAFGARRISARRLANTTTSGVLIRLHLRVSSQTKLQRAWWTRQLRQQRGPSLSCCVPVPRRVTFTTGGGRAQICFRWGGLRRWRGIARLRRHSSSLCSDDALRDVAQLDVTKRTHFNSASRIGPGQMNLRRWLDHLCLGPVNVGTPEHDTVR